jgi:HEAT repeat protein
LTNPDQVIVAEIAQLLGLFRKDAADAVKALVRISFINNTSIRANAIASLGLVAEKDEICIPVLQRFTKDEDVGVRRNAVAALGCFAQAAHTAAQELVEALEDDDAVVREFAAGVLYESGSVPLPLVMQIANLYKNADPFVRYCIIKLLANIRRESETTSAQQFSLEAIATVPQSAVYRVSRRVQQKLAVG